MPNQRFNAPTLQRFNAAVTLLPWLLLLLSGLVLVSCTAYPWSGGRTPEPSPTPTALIDPYNAAVATAEAAPDLVARSQAYVERGNTYYGLQEYEAALHDYTLAIALEPYNARAFNNRALIYAETGQDDLAMADYASAIALDPNYVRAYWNRLNLREKNNDLEGMVADYGALAVIDLRHRDDYLYQQGTILRRLGDIDAAHGAYDFTLTTNPHHVDALYERAVILLGKGQMAEALSDVNLALQLSPRAANAYYLRGLIYRESGNTINAVDDFTQALSFRPDYAEALLGRAEAFHANGDDAGAAADLARLAGLELDADLQHIAAVLNQQVLGNPLP
ncbi:MAG: tetratricopeptide repeat protein [Chloroflexaceae bacterium]|nr:tetratricopeptide repeat protein [Chloroflexaceae bacterium]